MAERPPDPAKHDPGELIQVASELMDADRDKVTNADMKEIGAELGVPSEYIDRAVAEVARPGRPTPLLVPSIIALVLLSAVASCAKKAPAPGRAAVTPSLSRQEANPDGSVAPTPLGSGVGPLVDLLYATRAAIAVSSSVDNPKDFPEHLIDYKKDTAWNGKTGDLAGWIAFRVPKDAWVARIEITAGFDKVAKDGTDLFTANHRIKRVRVSRDGQPIGEHTLDIEQRAAQRISIEKDGGEYKIEVLETVPGTKKEWRELVVSELHAMGRPSRFERETGEQPRVLVGTLEAPMAHTPAKHWVDGFYPSIEAMCAAQKKETAPRLAADSKEISTYWGATVLTARCDRAKLAFKAALAPPFLDLAAITYETGYSDSTSYVMRTTTGWRVATVLPGGTHSHLDTGCPSNRYEEHVTDIRAVVEPMPMLVVTDVVTIYDGLGDLDTRRVKTCRLTDERLDCTKPVAINEARRADQQSTSEDGRTPAKGWGKDTPFAIEPDGSVKRLERFDSMMEQILAGRAPRP